MPSRVIRLLGSSCRAQTTVVLVISSLAALSVTRAFEAANDARAKWDGTERAYMLLAPVADGVEITQDAVKEVRLPPALVPDERLRDLRPDMRARVALPANVVLVISMLDAAVKYPASWRVVALPDGTPIPPVSEGDEVDVIAGTDVLVEAAVVASVSPLTLAVPPERAPEVAAAVRIADFSVLTR
ncbi:MAG: hypothetical protein ACO3RB_01910 [Ilumatobacteraceae bacterium]